MFIGREDELGFLQSKYNQQSGQLIVLYGRRRIGKTETLRKFCEDKEHIFYSCIECPDEQQLAGISFRILQEDNPAAKYITKFQEWKQVFENIGETATENRKKLLVIDEFPYMVKNNTSIPSVLQNVWDEKLKNKNVMIILCGSAMSFIEKEVLSEKNPLYGRATGILKMKEMNFFDAIKFIPDYSIEEQITVYSILGGIPHYLKQFNDQISLKENIIQNILTTGSILYSEVEFLLRQELRETSIYNAIIEAVALGNTRLNDIYQKTQIDKSKISAYLKNLMDLGIVCREFSVDAKIKEQANVSRGLYQLTDNYFRFWYAFVFQNQSELEDGDAEGIWNYVVKTELDNFVSHIFEKICIQYLRKQNKQNKLPFHFVQIGRWWNKTDEIDVMAVDRTKKKILLGECKYKNTKMQVSDLRHLQEKYKLGESEKAFFWLFSKKGFSDELLRVAKLEAVNLVTLNELIL